MPIDKSSIGRGGARMSRPALNWRNLLEWTLTTVVLITMPIWALPVLIAVIFWDSLKSLHKVLWDK